MRFSSGPTKLSVIAGVHIKRGSTVLKFAILSHRDDEIKTKLR